MTTPAANAMTEPPFPIPVSLAQWGRLIADQDADWQLLSYGMQEGSGLVRKLVTRNRASGWVYVATTAAQFRDDTDWTDETDVLTTLYPAVNRTVYDMPPSQLPVAVPLI